VDTQAMFQSLMATLNFSL